MEVGWTEAWRFVQLAGLDAPDGGPGSAKERDGLILVAFQWACQFVFLIGAVLSIGCAPENQRVRTFVFRFLHSFVEFFVC